MSITKLDILKQTHKHLAIESDFKSKSTYLCWAVTFACAELEHSDYDTASSNSVVNSIQGNICTKILWLGCMEKFLENLTGKRPTPAEAFEARVKLLNELIAEEENEND